MEKSMRFTAAGDALIMRRVPVNDPGFRELQNFIARGEARMVNLETTISDGTLFASALSGGTWLTTDEQILADLLLYGFNMIGWSNNHTLDYGYEGVRSTKRALERANVAHAGGGENLFEASRPAVVDGDRARAAMIAICSSFNPASRAGSQTPSMPGRPGLNPLGHSEVYRVSAEQLNSLKEIADSTRMNAYHEMMVEQGFRLPDPEGLFRFGNMLFTEGEQAGKHTTAAKKDVQRTQRAIGDALRVNDYVVVMTHSHEIKSDSDEEADYFLEEFARACIDAGACAVVGGGTHQLKGIELYKGKPIFYSLGNFIFQNDQVKKLPADFLEQYGLPLDATAPEAIAARASCATGGLQSNIRAYQTVIPYFEMRDGELAELTLLPVSLGADRPNHFKSFPVPADEECARDICAYLERVSARYGTKLSLREGLIRVAI